MCLLRHSIVWALATQSRATLGISYENEGADRRRWAGGTNAGHGSGLARHRCRRRRAPPSQRPAEREVRSDRRPLHGDLPAARRGRQAARHRAACGLSQRHRLGDERHRHRALPRTHSGARRAWHACRSRAGHDLADARAHASLQSEVLRAGAVRARCGAAAHPHPASHRDHGSGPGRAGRDRERRRPR